ncbi:hypothetical protein SAMN04488503_2219 [Humidesulfovibrio mexicanus]|uniref:Uncharacterized protein n=1 Tax=Humidesulfovibrio mexicanus TaxID=147047 RepID=A0A239ATP9_9BACT|nr:hypothetical protein [Humidesulfovibrio mexicanus]SNR99075.1 hypothetical protein SAMN04488503_2219 [Humidesulfovibrio mexicanus]
MTELTKTVRRENLDQADEKLPLGLHIAGWLAVAWAIVVLLIDLNADNIFGR